MEKTVIGKIPLRATLSMNAQYKHRENRDAADHIVLMKTQHLTQRYSEHTSSSFGFTGGAEAHLVLHETEQLTSIGGATAHLVLLDTEVFIG